MRGGVVFCEDAGAVVGAEEEDGVDGEEGEVGGHGAVVGRGERGRGWRIWLREGRCGLSISAEWRDVVL